jgi:hypothetical protein
VSDERVLRRIFERKGKEVKGGCNNEELCNFRFSQNIIMLIKLRNINWAGYVAYMGKMRNS